MRWASSRERQGSTVADTVKITIAGDSKPAEDAFSRVGDAGDRMSRRVSEAGDGFTRAGERADELDTKAMGFRDTLTGIQDTTKGLKAVASGDWGFESLLTLGAGIGDLGSGLYNFLIPSLKAAKTAMMGLNLTFLASPITWVIIGIVALVAAFVILWKKSEAFRNFWKGAWAGIRAAAEAVGNWFRNTLWPGVRGVWDSLTRKADSFKAFMRRIPGELRSAFAKVTSFLFAPFRAAFNAVSSAWNSTIGRLHWSVPGWVPGIGGASISAPRLPYFHNGGIVGGPAGSETLAVLQSGERVIPAGGGGEAVHVTVRLDRDVLIDAWALGIRQRGGNAQQVVRA